MRASQGSSSRSGRSFALGVAALALGVLAIGASAARAQGFGPDPFRPYNTQFDPFVYPVAPTPGDYGYNAALSGVNGIRGANQFSNYLNSLGAIGGPRSGAGVPYYQANRRYDRQYDRLYQPNRDADARFEASRADATDLYFRYLREKDPKKRADLFRQYTRAQNRAERELAAPSPRPGGTRAAARGGAAGAASEDEAPPIDRARGRGDEASAPPLPGGSRLRGDATRGRGSSLDSAPDLPGRSRSSALSRRGSRPSDVLERAERSERSESLIRRPRPR